ncbi:MAG: helicase, partial [Prevotella buccalis]|nr:helicase [Hoylesella buccalis]
MSVLMSSQSAISELKRQKLLLQLEYATEKDAFRKQTEMMGIARKVKRGDAWFPVRVGKSFYNSLNQLAVEVFRAVDEEISHNFEYGRPVAFFQMVQKAGRHDEMGKNNASVASKSLSYFPVTGMVSYADNDRMVVTLPDNG